MHCNAEQTAQERQDSPPCAYLARHELVSVQIVVAYCYALFLCIAHQRDAVRGLKGLMGLLLRASGSKKCPIVGAITHQARSNCLLELDTEALW